MNKRSFLVMATAGVLSGAVSQVAFAQKVAGMSTQDYYTRIQGLRRPANSVVVFDEAPWIVAKVKSINVGSGMMTVSHGPISQIKMPAMTMAFPVKNPADLTAHKAGDVIQFQLDKDGGVVKIVHVRAAND